MEFSDADLVALRSRCLMASQRGYGIARADEYMEALGADGESAAQLYEAATLEIQARASGGKKPKKDKKDKKVEKVEKAEAPKPAPKPAAPPAPKVEEKKEPPKVVEVKKDPAPVPYEEWTSKELYAEAQARDIHGRSEMDKDGLILALMEDDELKAKK